MYNKKIRRKEPFKVDTKVRTIDKNTSNAFCGLDALMSNFRSTNKVY